MLFLTLKSLHIISIVCWFAGLFYLPRLFVYHSSKNITRDTIELFKIMEYRLYYYIILPSMFLVLITGLITKIIIGWSFPFWFIIKLIFVCLILLYQYSLYLHLNNFQQDKNTKSSKYFRILNELPTVFLIIIIFSSVFKY